MLYQVLALLTVHYVADFVLQTHWMAQNKSKDLNALGAHVLVYTVCLFVTAPFIFSNGSVTDGWTWIVLNGALHFITDRVTSRWTSKLWAQQRWHDFFAVVGFDQLIHYTTLLLTARATNLF